jgi:small subunit ribosomal protein S4
MFNNPSFAPKMPPEALGQLSHNDPRTDLTAGANIPRNRLLAGRFRPALRFATRGPPRAFEADLSAPGYFVYPGAQEGASPQNSNPIEDAMTKRSEAKYKIDRRMGQNIWGRPKSPVNRREYGPGQHGQRRKGKLSDFGVQLRAKQKLKGYYANISERQFHGIYVEAGRMKGDTGENLIGLLERRLDTVVYRAKFVATMFAARQFINHGHIKVNGRRVNISSYKVKPGDQIEIKESSKQLTPVLEAVQLGERDVPDFIEADHSKMTATFTRIPALSDVPFAVQMEPHLIVEFYSR